MKFLGCLLGSGKQGSGRSTGRLRTMRRKCSRYGEGLVAGRGGEDLKNVASVRPLTVLPGVALGRVPAPGRSSLRRPESACPEGRALSRAALSRDCSGSRSPGGLAGAVRAAASAAEGILWRRGGRGEQSGCVPDGPLQPPVTRAPAFGSGPSTPARGG